jgi:GT2 family glycosyltransferase
MQYTRGIIYHTNYHSAAETINCVSSIFQHYRKASDEIIIVDNCCKEEDIQLSKKQLNNKRIIIRDKPNF